MPRNPERFVYRHLQLPSEYTEPERYKSAKGRGKDVKLRQRIREAHRALLLGQLEHVQQELARLDERREAMGISGFEGVTVVFRSEPDYELTHESLDLRLGY